MNLRNISGGCQSEGLVLLNKKTPAIISPQAGINGRAPKTTPVKIINQAKISFNRRLMFCFLVMTSLLVSHHREDEPLHMSQES